MLDAACPGQVFTSPTPDQIEAATRAVDSGAGVLHIVKNYTGDIMNFEMATELCQGNGVKVQAAIINDDVAVENSLYTAGRRGVGTTVLAEKICGAAAGRGYDLARLAALCRRVNEGGRSMGMALTSCTVPAVGKPTFELGENEMEMGIGIRRARPRTDRTPRSAGDHGAPGPDRPRGSSISRQRPGHRHGERHGRHASNGAISRLSGIRADFARPRNRDRAPVGGQLHHKPRDGRLLYYASEGGRRITVVVGRSRADAGLAVGDLTRVAVSQNDVLAWLEALQQIYAENKQLLTDLDAAIGDADHGINMDRGFTEVKAELGTNVPGDLQSILQAAATALIRTVGGAAGPLYGTFFLRASVAASGKTELDGAEVVTLFQAGIEGVQQRGKAIAGDKTMVDALLPALAAMRASLEGGAGLASILYEGAAAAEAGMRATIPMQARKGRASYLGERSIGHQDPGATSSYLLLKTAASVWGHPNNS